MTYGSGNFYASQQLALERLVDYLRIAETGDLKALLDKVDANTDDVEAHPNAVILEAIFMLNDLTIGTHKSMAGFASLRLRDFAKRRAHSSGIHIPSMRLDL